MITETAKIRLRRPRILTGILGQSIETGALPSSYLSTYPTAFKSSINPTVQVPFGPGVSTAGSWWPKVYDDLYAWGYDLKFVQGGAGGMSILRDLTNFVGARANNYGYAQRRSPSGLADDRGDAGAYCYVGTRVFNCTTGRTRFAINKSQFLNSQGLSRRLSVEVTGAQATAATEPAGMSTANVGDTITDGTIVWTCVATDFTGVYANLVGTGKIMTAAFHTGYGFDPLGLIQRLIDALQAERDAERRVVYIQNGQGDLYVSSASYSNGLQQAANLFLAYGFDVMIGLTSFSPGASGGTTGNYDLLAAGRADAVTALQAAFPGKVFDGANLYASMGSTGPMALGGAFLQSDNVHLSGPGLVGPPSGGVNPASKYVSDAFKAILPQLVA